MGEAIAAERQGGGENQPQRKGPARFHLGRRGQDRTGGGGGGGEQEESRPTPAVARGDGSGQESRQEQGPGARRGADHGANHLERQGRSEAREVRSPDRPARAAGQGGEHVKAPSEGEQEGARV